MADWKDWSDGWIKNGHFISFLRENTYVFEHVTQQDLLHYVWDWEVDHVRDVAPLATSGPVVPEFLELTKSFDPKKNENFVWQLIFGIKGQIYLYVELPTDTHRHGLPKMPKPRTDHRAVSQFEEWMSPFHEPTFVTEHFFERDSGLDRINLEVYNPENITLHDIKLRFLINSMITERIGTVTNGVQEPSSTRWQDTLDKLWRRQIPCRPITLYPVRLPAEAQH